MTGMTFTGSLPLHKELSEMMQELEAARSKLLHLRGDHYLWRHSQRRYHHAV